MVKKLVTARQLSEGRVRTHGAEAFVDKYTKHATPMHKSSIFVVYETKKGELRWRNSGVCTLATPRLTLAVEEGQQLAKRYAIPYDTQRQSLHNVLVAAAPPSDYKAVVKVVQQRLQMVRRTPGS